VHNNNKQQQQQQQSIAESNSSNINNDSNSNSITSAINSNGDTVTVIGDTTTTTTTTAATTNNAVLGSTSDEIPDADATAAVVVNTTSTINEEESTTKEETIATTTTIDSSTDGDGGSGSGNEDKEDNNNEDGSGTSEIESTANSATKEESIAAADTTTIDSPTDSGGGGSDDKGDHNEDGGNSATKEEETFAAAPTPTTIDLSTDGRESFVEKLHGIQLLLEASFPATTTTALNTLGSPQAMAFDWLVQSDGLVLSVKTSSVTELEQRFAAATFYFATNGVSDGNSNSNGDDGDEGWTSSLGFLSATSICHWNDGKYGIFCHNDDDSSPTVKQIRIVDNNLSGSIPEEIKYFAELETLDLYYNKLTGTIPDLFRLSFLRQIDVDGNMLSGVIPGSLFNHPSLVNIYLLNNEKLTGTFPDNLSTKLEKISLSGCSFTGTLPPSITALSTLRLFEVKENAFTGTIPLGLLSLPQLDTLGLHGNRFVGRIPSPLDIDTNDRDNDSDSDEREGSVLRSLSLGSNSLTGSLPDGMEVLTALQFFYAHDNALTGTIRGEVIDLPLLRQLWLYDNKLSGEIPAFSYPSSSSSSSSSNTVLTELYLNDNDLSGNLHDLLASAPTTIERFDLSHNPKLGGFISDDISLFESLSYFVVSHCSLVGDLPAESLNQLVNVHTFDVAENQLESTIPTEIGRMINLQELNLSRNVFTGVLPGEELSNLISLTSFDVSQNPYLRGDLTSTVCAALGNQLVFAAADCAATAVAVAVAVEGEGDPARSLGLAEGNSLGLADGSLGLAAGFSEGVDCDCCLCS